MARRKRYIKGRIYVTNDSVFSRDGYSKPGRRVVAVNNDRQRMHVVKIKGLYDDSGNRRPKLIPIEHYNVLHKPSGIYPYVHKKTGQGNPIQENKLKKTKARLNKWDMRKIERLK